MKSQDSKNTTPIDEIVATDPYLYPYRGVIRSRAEKIKQTERRLTGDRMSLADFAAGHEYFGLHHRGDGWIFREWAPAATDVYLIGDRTGWRETRAFALTNIGDGVWEIRLPVDSMQHGDLYRLSIHWPGGSGDRVPAYARRVVQDPDTLIFNAQVWCPPTPYQWQVLDFRPTGDPPLIYEAHVGMAQETEGIGTFDAFRQNVLPRVVAAGYNTLQLMAVQEHPYYASFGYHVSSFFAASSRFGSPDSLKCLIDAAHDAGLAVIMDLIHSHAVNNEAEGLSRFDGTRHQYFHEGGRGSHPAWDSRCFDYGKLGVLHFLLSNCRFWLDEYRFDGFRFDGITSMLYHHHGLGKAFTSYADYFDGTVDEDALVYLALANKVVHQVRSDALTIAEDMSGMPTLALPGERGGLGFDYRLAMGVPDYWIKLVKDTPDDRWQMGELWRELTNRRREERTINYAESHDQALVGDQTLISRLVGADIYDHMRTDDSALTVDRGLALHKMIRLITIGTAGSGYLNFMGNEFGHPEWIDFPREGNNWSFRYARRQWHLADDSALKYHSLAIFDRDMIALMKERHILEDQTLILRHEHDDDKVIVFERGGLVFAFNFHPTLSRVDYPITVPPGNYRMIFHTDRGRYGGHRRLHPNQVHFTRPHHHSPNRHSLSLYLPARCALVLETKSRSQPATL